MGIKIVIKKKRNILKNKKWAINPNKKNKKTCYN